MIIVSYAGYFYNFTVYYHALMNYKPLLLLFLALFSLDICVAQQITEPLSRLVARGSLPGEFCTSATKLPYLNKQSLQTADRKLTQKQVRRFQQSIDYTPGRSGKRGVKF